ncbi:hypothetical protein VNO77_39661 [Canavalia gladiata]|uniref:Uncharacterized protein n=1 Tax=Canavalia gladiata TaxID=3824 RepID=A0AAN9JZB7_CANGL
MTETLVMTKPSHASLTLPSDALYHLLFLKIHKHERNTSDLHCVKTTTIIGVKMQSNNVALFNVEMERTIRGVKPPFPRINKYHHTKLKGQQMKT